MHFNWKSTWTASLLVLRLQSPAYSQQDPETAWANCCLSRLLLFPCVFRLDCSEIALFFTHLLNWTFGAVFLKDFQYVLNVSLGLGSWGLVDIGHILKHCRRFKRSRMMFGWDWIYGDTTLRRQGTSRNVEILFSVLFCFSILILCFEFVSFKWWSLSNEFDLYFTCKNHAITSFSIKTSRRESVSKWKPFKQVHFWKSYVLHQCNLTQL